MSSLMLTDPFYVKINTSIWQGLDEPQHEKFTNSLFPSTSD